MNPRLSAHDGDKGTSTKTPFEQIAAVEEHEEERVTSTLAAMEQEARETERALQNHTIVEEEKMEAAAQAEITAYSETEPAVVLARTKQEMEEEIAALKEAFRTRGARLAAEVSESVLDFSHLSPRS